MQVSSANLEERIDLLRAGNQALGERTSIVNHQFEESLEAMKATKLHVDLAKAMDSQTTKETDQDTKLERPSLTLMDVYYEEGKLKAWRDNLIKQTSSNQRKVDRLGEAHVKLRGLTFHYLRAETGF